MKKKPVKEFIIDVQNDHAEGADAARMIRRMAKRFLGFLGLDNVELSIVITSDSRIRVLNRQWRGKNEATDVLSFPACQEEGFSRTRLLGDIVISLDTARKQACSQKVSVEQELARYLAHGLLHLLGHDHYQPQQTALMASLEEQLLGGVGLVGKAALSET
jgi:probable rRNA maturation factor